VISDSDLAALQQHFTSGRTPAQWRSRVRPSLPEVTVMLNVVALAMDPVGDEDPWIAVDGSADRCRGSGACAAVSSAGHILAGWNDDGLPVAPYAAPAYWELQGIRLGMRLSATQSPDKTIPVVCDSHKVVQQVRSAVGGGRFDPAVFGCADLALFSEVTRLGRDRPVMVVHRAHRETGGNHRTAAGPLEGVAHRLAWLITRLLRDGLVGQQPLGP
jgi:hypothetical protein